MPNTALAERFCIHCSDSFVPNHFNQKLCSHECKSERSKAQCKLWDQNNKEKKSAYNARKHAENKDHYRNQSFKERYGLSVDEIRQKIADQDFKCAICAVQIEFDVFPNAHNRAHVDHCHETGVVRDMLCAKCNWMLGNSNDKSSVLEAGARYLREWSNAE